jgi:hypothetical protein
MASPSFQPVASLRSPTTQATTGRGCRHRAVHVQTFRSFRPTQLHSSSTSRTSPSSAGRRVSATGGGEQRLFWNPFQDCPDGDPIQPTQSPQDDPLLIGSQNLFLLGLRVSHLGFQDPIGPTGLAVVLLVSVSIPSILDDVHTPASAARGSRRR